MELQLLQLLIAQNLCFELLGLFGWFGFVIVSWGEKKGSNRY